MNKQINIYGVITTPKELLHHSIVNFLYGVMSWLPTTFVMLKYDLLFFITVIMYYITLSVVLNRESYNTRLGKYIIFPFASGVGAFAGYKLSLWISTVL